MLSMWVRFTGSNVATNKSLNVRFENGAGTLVANTINLFNFGLQRNLLNVWQLVVIPITSFGVLPTSVKGLKIIMAGGTVGQARQWDIDLISLTDNSVPSINEQAFNILKDGALVGQSSTLNFKGAPVTVTNDPINKKIDVEVIGGGGTPAGSDTQIQYNNAGAFGADSGFTRDVAGGSTTILNTTDFGGGETIDGGITTSGGITTIEQIYSSSGVPILGSFLLVDSTENEVSLTTNEFSTDNTNGFYAKGGMTVVGNYFGGNGTKITIDDGTEQITIGNIKAYDDDAAAGVGGLTTGMVYMTTGSGAAPLNTAGILMIKQ